MLCSRCRKREGELKVGGRLLCAMCAREEVLARAKSILHQAGVIGWRAAVEVVVPKGWEALKDVTALAVKKSCQKCEMSVEVKAIEASDPLDAVWRLILESGKSGKPVVAPFTSEFFSALSIYSITRGIHDYLVFSPPVYSYGNSKVVSPLSSTTLAELRSFGEFKLETGDGLFADIFSWLASYFEASQEQARAFWKSYEVLNRLAKSRCRVCGALLKEGSDLCPRCSAL